MTATHLHRSNAARRARPPHPGRPPPPFRTTRIPTTQTRKDGSKFILETTNIPSPPATSKLIFPTPMDIRMQFHTPLVFSPGEAGKCATFRPTDKEKRIHDDGRDAETSAVVRGSTEGFAHVDVVDECGGAELRQGAVGPRGGAGVVSTAAWVDRIGGAGFYGSQILPVGGETTLKLYSNSKREFLTW
ncbi:hypothetical protein MCOR29_009688 [Pyricularia oryzae]|nr:hypothetical protein MCOR29_009688 [Pyricularia oryzae]KAI6435332.1 hypothetical protein MCOR21_001842 [Pyricularia oryzae]KAI6581892.1 hypothetical protein MCOR06_008828 [Pyricularia oryzae]